MADVIYSGGATDTQVVVDKDGVPERGVKVMAVSGDLLYDGGATDTKVVVQTDDGPEAAEKVYNLNDAGGGTSDYSDLTNKPKINSVTLSGNQSAADLRLQDATTITTLTTASVELVSNTIYNGGELASVTLTLPATVPADFIAQVEFTSGATPTLFTAPAALYFNGDRCEAGTFTPIASHRYCIMIISDGANTLGFCYER